MIEIYTIIFRHVYLEVAEGTVETGTNRVMELLKTVDIKVLFGKISAPRNHYTIDMILRLEDI